METQDYKKNSYLSTAIFAFVVSFVASQLLLALGNSLLATIAKYAELPIEQVSSSLWSLAFLNIINQGTFFGVFWFVYKRNKPVFSTNIFSRPNWLILIICIVTGIASLYLLSPVVNIVEWALTLIPLKSGGIGFEIDSFGRMVYALFILGLLPAVCEELLFRGAIFNCLRTKSHTFAIIMSAVMFGIFHMSGYQFVYPILFGILLGLIMSKWGNIWYCIITHFVNNAFVIVSNYLSPSGTLTAPTMFEIVICILLVALFVGVIIGFSKLKLHINKEYHDLTVAHQSQFIFWIGLVCMIVIWLLVVLSGLA